MKGSAECGLGLGDKSTLPYLICPPPVGAPGHLYSPLPSPKSHLVLSFILLIQYIEERLTECILIKEQAV